MSVAGRTGAAHEPHARQRARGGRAYDAATRTSGACAQCQRRSWLLSTLSGSLDCCARDRDRLQALLALEDVELIEATGGRRRAELHAEYDAFRERAPHQSVDALCRHDSRYPPALQGAYGAPHMLNVLGGVERLSALCSAPAVAILGSPRPSDYGRTVARSLARGLSASGVSVICGWQDGIAVAALEGALEGSGAAVAVLGDGLAVATPVRRRALLDRLSRVGCAVSELPCECNGRRWATLASERTVVWLAAVAIVVEAEQTAGDLAAAGLARALGRTVAAVPGRVTSPLARGTNALLRDGARIVLDAKDVLELLYETDRSRALISMPASGTHQPPQPREHPQPSPRAPAPALPPRLGNLLALVGSGSDTPEQLAREGIDMSDALLALSELELMGLLSRGDGGRYLPTVPAGGCK